MNKIRHKNGFTLVELLVSMSLLAFVIMMSATLFDKAIQNTPKTKKAIETQTLNNSLMEKALINAKDYCGYYKYISDLTKTLGRTPYPKEILIEKPSGYDENKAYLTTNITNLGLQIGSKTINDVQGYFISTENDTNIKYNNLSSTDKLFSFVGLGHTKSPTSYIDNMYMYYNRFIFYPLNSSAPLKLYAYYKISPKNIENFYAARIRFLKSPISSEDNSVIYQPFADEQGYPFLNSLINNLSFNFIGEYKEIKDTNSYYDIDIPNYSTDKQSYLDTIDTDIAASGMTLNKNGFIGIENSTFANNIATAQTSNHFIGLPYDDQESLGIDLLKMFDYDLVISNKIGTPKYVCLYNPSFASNTAFKNIVSNNGSNYSFDWKNGSSYLYETRDLLGLKSDNYNSIDIQKGFLPQITVKDSDNISYQIPSYNKTYGNSVYYPLNSNKSNISWSTYNGNYNMISKINLKNYNKQYLNNDISNPITLISHNFNISTGKVSDSRYYKDGFCLFLDSNGQLYLNKAIYDNYYKIYKYSTENLGININNTNLFTNSKEFNFDNILGRKDFNILSTQISKNGSTSNVKIYALYRNDMTKLDTTMVKIFDKTFNNLQEYADSSGYGYSNFEFYAMPSTIYNTIIYNKSYIDVAQAIPNPAPNGAMEISNLYFYKQTNYIDRVSNATMDYLYRKYLTESERKTSGYDDYFMSKY